MICGTFLTDFTHPSTDQERLITTFYGNLYIQFDQT